MSDFRALTDRVIVKRDDVKNVTTGGVILVREDKPIEGTVVVVGPGLSVNGEVAPLQVQVGERVLFDKREGKDITIRDQEYVVLRECDIYGVVG